MTPALVPGLRNCHAYGVHSVVLSRYPDGRPRRRIFVALSNHELWQNDSKDGRYSVAIHSHRTELTLTRVAGPIHQVCARFDCAALLHEGWLFSSAIRGGGAGGFVHYSSVSHIAVDEPEQLTHTVMAADDMHTVWVPRHERAAWIVEEGREIGPDRPCYSNADLSAWPPSGLYTPMSQEKCDELLSLVWGIE